MALPRKLAAKVKAGERVLPASVTSKARKAATERMSPGAIAERKRQEELAKAERARIRLENRNKVIDNVQRLKERIWGSSVKWDAAASRAAIDKVPETGKPRTIASMHRIERYLKAVLANVAGEVNIEDYLDLDYGDDDGLYYH